MNIIYENLILQNELKKPNNNEYESSDNNSLSSNKNYNLTKKEELKINIEFFNHTIENSYSSSSSEKCVSEKSDNIYEFIKFKEFNFYNKLYEIIENSKLNKIKKETELKIISFLADEYQFLSFSHSEPFIYKNLFDSLNYLNEYNDNQKKYDTYNKFFKKIEEQFIPILKDIDYYDLNSKIFNIIHTVKELKSFQSKNILLVQFINKNIILDSLFKNTKYLDNLLSSNNNQLYKHYYLHSDELSELSESKISNEEINDIYKKMLKYSHNTELFIEKSYIKNKREKELFKDQKKDIVIINLIEKQKNIIIQNENINDEDIFENILYHMNYLKEDGELWLNMNNIYDKRVFIEFLYIISNFFEKTIFKKDKIYLNDAKSGMFIFKNFKNIDLFEKIYEGYLNQKNIFLNSNSINTIIKIKSFINFHKIPKNYLKFLYKIYNSIDNSMDFYLKKVNFIYEKLFVKKLDEKFYNYFNYISKTCLEWCKENNYLIDENYESKIQRNFTSDYFKFKFFPKEKGVDIKKITLTYESVYSVSAAEDAEETTQFILKNFPFACTILDATSNVGGNTINFAKYFEKVYSIEIDDQTYDALKKNVILYYRKNVECIKGDYTLLKEDFHTDLVFFDPPWGGIYYKLNSNIDMYLSGINIVDILPDNFVLKAPINYNIESLLNKYKNLIIHKMNNYLIIINQDYVDFWNKNNTNIKKNNSYQINHINQSNNINSNQKILFTNHFSNIK